MFTQNIDMILAMVSYRQEQALAEARRNQLVKMPGARGRVLLPMDARYLLTQDCIPTPPGNLIGRRFRVPQHPSLAPLLPIRRPRSET